MRKRIVCILIAVVVACGVAVWLSIRADWHRALGYSYSWEQYAFPGVRHTGAIACRDDGLLFVSFDVGGVYRSTDYGQTWAWAGKGMMHCWVRSIAIHPDGTIYLGSGAGVYRSKDKGLHWVLVNNGLTDLGVTTLAIDNKGRIYVCTEERKLFRKRNDSSPWERIDSGPVKANSCRFALDDKGNMYVGTYEATLFRSTDEGTTWRNIPIQTPGGRDGRIDEIVVAPSGTIFIRNNGTILRRRASSKSWTQLSAGTSFSWLIGNPKFYSLAIAEHGRLIAGADQGIFVSDNDGDDMLYSVSIVRRFVGQVPVGIKSVVADHEGRVYAADWTSRVFCGIRTSP